MRKARIRVGGGVKGRLIFYSYEISGDFWNGSRTIIEKNFAFLSRRDKTGLTPFLYGLRDGMKRFGEEAEDQYELVFHCFNSRLYTLLTTWGEGYRDPLILNLLSEIKNLSNRIGYLKVRFSKPTETESRLAGIARRYLRETVKKILEEAESWVSSEDGYLIYILKESSKIVPLEYLSSIELKRWVNFKGMILMRRSGSLTKLFYHSLNGSKHVIEALKSIDPGYLKMWAGTYKCLYLTRTPPEKLEDLLLEVFLRWSKT